MRTSGIISTVIPPGNLWGAMKEFYDRGGFAHTIVRPFGREWYVKGEVGPTTDFDGSDSNSGRSFNNPLRTMNRALELVDDFDIIYVSGVIREQVISPVGVYDVAIVGSAGRPRQATDSGVATGGGATWISPASPTATTALLKLIQAGWSVENIFFAPVASSSCITIQRAAAAPPIPEKDGSHALISRCKFAGGGSGGNGVLFLDGGYNCEISDNEFESLTGTAILSSGTGVSIPLQGRILRNDFHGNTNIIAISASDFIVKNNILRGPVNNSANKINLVSVSAQGLNNMVIDNWLSDATANVTIAKGYKPGTSDIWRNWVTDAVDPIIVVPS